MFTAKDVLDVHWDGNVPVNIFDISHEMSIKMVLDDSLDCLAKIKLVNGLPVIWYKKHQNEMVTNFAVSHCVAHFTLGHLSSKTEFKEFAENFSTVVSDLNESDASKFVLDLLIPTRVLMYLIEKNGLTSISGIAKIFKVSEVAILQKLKILDLIK